MEDLGDEAGVDAGALRGQVDAVPEEAFAAFFGRTWPRGFRWCGASFEASAIASFDSSCQETGAWSEIRKSWPTLVVALRSASMSSP